MVVKERTLTQEIAWRLADVYAAQTHGNYDEETLFDRGGDWAADEVGKVLSERLGVPTEALEAGVVRELIEAAMRYLAATTRESDDDPNCWAEEEFAKDRLRQILAKVWGVRRDGGLDT